MSAVLQLPTLHPAFDAMRPYPQWMVYQLHSPKGGKYQKQPIDHRTGKTPRKGHGGAEICTTFDVAAARAAQLGSKYGVGFSFTEADPFWFLDIDNCAVRDDKGAHIGWSELANNLCAMFPGAAVEVSSSASGLHVIGSGTVPEGHKCKHTQLGIEFYSRDRWVALTGLSAQGNAGTDCTAAVAALVAEFFAPGTDGPKAEWTDAPLWHVPGSDDDAKLIERMRASRSSGDSATIEQLWTADADALSKHYPAQKPNEAYDPSGADQGLANHVVWWTGGNCERAKRIMQQSALNRGKWEREDYIPETILNALQLVSENPPKSSTPDAATVGFGQGPKPAGCSPVPLAPAAHVVPVGTPTRLTLRAANDFTQLPPVEWRIKGLLPKLGLGAIYGPSGSGKSFLLLDMLGAISAGQTWFGRRVKSARSVYIALEGEAGIAQRVKAYINRNGPLASVDIITGAFDLRRPDDVAALIAAVRGSKWTGEGIIAVDTLNAAMPGGDENSPVDMGLAVAGLKTIQRELGGFVLATHHVGKDVSKGLRGHSLLLAALDTTVEVIRNDGEAMRAWKVGKSKDGPDGDNSRFMLEAIPVGRDEDGELITSCVVVSEAAQGVPLAPPKPMRPKLQKRQREAWGHVQALIAASRQRTDDGKPCVSFKLAEEMVAKALPYSKESNKRTGAGQALRALIDNGYLGFARDMIWANE